MKLICPECGATACAAAWSNDAEAREVLAAIVKLPPQIAANILPYLGLFRPGKRALAWKRARKIVGDLVALTASGHVQIQGKAARKCPPAIWAQAMEDMAARRDRLQLPLKNHNYLKHVAWPLADAADAQQERARNMAERSGAIRTMGDDEPGPGFETMTEAEKAMLPPSLREKFGI